MSFQVHVWQAEGGSGEGFVSGTFFLLPGAGRSISFHIWDIYIYIFNLLLLCLNVFHRIFSLYLSQERWVHAGYGHSECYQGNYPVALDSHPHHFLVGFMKHASYDSTFISVYMLHTHTHKPGTSLSAYHPLCLPLCIRRAKVGGRWEERLLVHMQLSLSKYRSHEWLSIISHTHPSSTRFLISASLICSTLLE